MSTPGREIHVYNRQRQVRVDLKALNGVARRSVEVIGSLAVPGRRARTLPEEIDVLLVSDRRIAAIHRQFMNLAGPTDVITFQHGEIFISTETARENARRFGNGVGEELELYIVHGLLHLRGFDDKDASNARRMRATQGRLVKDLRRRKSTKAGR
jgi:probable rRNA maturation factor